MNNKYVLLGLLGSTLFLVFLFSLSNPQGGSSPANTSNGNDDLEKELVKANEKLRRAEELLSTKELAEFEQVRKRACWWRNTRKKVHAGEIPCYGGQWNEAKCFWDLYQPTTECRRDRIGYIGDGGKWVCNFEELVSQPDGCVMFSFGVRDSVDFEWQFNQRGCKTYSYDPTPGVRPLVEKHLKPGMHFEEIGLGPVSGYPGDNPSYQLNGWPIKNFMDLAAATGVKKIDLIKIDIEGSEYSSLAYMLLHPEFKKFGVKQLLVEFHLFYSVDIVHQVFDIIEQAGYQIVMKESNNFCGPVCFEYVFLYVGPITCDQEK